MLEEFGHCMRQIISSAQSGIKCSRASGTWIIIFTFLSSSKQKRPSKCISDIIHVAMLCLKIAHAYIVCLRLGVEGRLCEMTFPEEGTVSINKDGRTR